MEVNLGYFFAMDKDFLLKLQSKRSIDKNNSGYCMIIAGRW